MKRFRITLEGQSYEVTINDPAANPMQVMVDGQVFRVQLEPVADAPAAASLPAAPAASSAVGRVIKAPMPGTINKISVSPGDRVEQGQELCVLEAMKMNNVIRAPGSGQIAQVRVTLKQSVQYGDVLMVFAD